MKKRILILTDPFGPPAYSPRTRNLATNLQQDGWKVCVCTEQMFGIDYQSSHFPLYQMPYYSAEKGITHFFQWLLDKLFQRKERLFLRFVIQHINPQDYDWILCSTFSDFPLWTALKLSQKYELPLAVDLRDIFEQWGNTSYTSGNHFLQRIFRKGYEHRALRLRNEVLKKAHFVTTVSPWHLKTLQSYNPQTHLIYNGFDAKEFMPSTQSVPKFIISYVGRIYDFNLRDPRPLFKAVKMLSDDYPNIKKDLLLQFHTEPACQQLLKEAIHQEQIDDLCSIRPFIPTQEAIELMQQSSICVILTHQTTPQGPFGIMTTKFFEILGVEKPALCIPSDGGVLEETFRMTQAGLISGDVLEIRDFILDRYHEWQTKGFTHQAVQHKELFTRQHQAQQFEQLFLSLCQK